MPKKSITVAAPGTPAGHSPVRTGAQIRQTFLDFFAEHGHTVVPAAPLVPGDDQTLLFTNSGMVQFKDVFLNTGDRPYARAADSQKCLRVAGKHNDLDDVGRDDSHHTFFEMLGNWSFGDYYKQEAITWAWQLLTDEWKLPKDRLWVTCFEDELGVIPRDDEAAEVWRRQPGFEPAHLLFFGRKENFWEMADTGPCGPDSEIHYDRGAEYCDKQGAPGHVCRVNGDCPRFLELWHLVCIQYTRTGPTELHPLPKKHVDTGMGLDRLVSVLQGVDSNYKTDLFAPLMEAIRRLTGHSEAERAANLTPYQVIADHARAATFLIAEGVMPGNESRNYVTRMIVRRAARFGRDLGLYEPFLARVCGAVVDNYGEAYPELVHNREAVLTAVTQEEKRFRRTVEAGEATLADLLAELRAAQERVVPGEIAFELYSRDGLPLEITRDIARGQGLEVDEAGFRRALEAHRIASGAGQAMGENGGEAALAYQKLLEDLRREGKLGPSGVEYDPYSRLEVTEPVVALLKDGQRVRRARDGENVEIVLPDTCFYVESGGQVCDSGQILGFRRRNIEQGQPDWVVEVTETRRPVPGLVVHAGRAVMGSPAEGDEAQAQVNDQRRWDIMRNHTATHLLHSELRYVLGEHVRQAGSLVAPDRLRFDFAHTGMLTQDELNRVTTSVNEAILANYPVDVEHMNREEAIKAGAMALFGEKYGEVVRAVRIGEPEAFSFELCGGTHVPETADIGPFVVVGESGVAANVRRIEAVTGRAAMHLIGARLARLETAAAYLGVGADEVDRKVLALMDELQLAQKEIARLTRGQARQTFEQLLPGIVRIKGVPVLAAAVKDFEAEALREMTDWFRDRVGSGVAVLASSLNNRPTVIASVSEDLVARGLDAVQLVREMAKVVGGGGGGKPTFAQAGGKDASRLNEALQKVAGWVEGALR